MPFCGKKTACCASFTILIMHIEMWKTQKNAPQRKKFSTPFLWKGWTNAIKSSFFRDLKPKECGKPRQVIHVFNISVVENFFRLFLHFWHSYHLTSRKGTKKGAWMLHLPFFGGGICVQEPRGGNPLSVSWKNVFFPSSAFGAFCGMESVDRRQLLCGVRKNQAGAWQSCPFASIISRKAHFAFPALP